jgi:hypothetical protein
MAKQKSQQSIMASVDALCAATGWNRYYAIGYLTVWRDATALAGIVRGDIRVILNSLPDQLAAFSTYPTAIIDVLVRTGELEQREDVFTIVANIEPQKGRKQATLALVESKCPGHWDAYSFAYQRRHSVSPTRNARVNSQMKELEKCIGCGDMDLFLEFYVAHPDYRYTNVQHTIGAALKDAESLHSQMRKGQPLMTGKVRGDAELDETREQMGRIFRKQIR